MYDVRRFRATKLNTQTLLQTHCFYIFNEFVLCVILPLNRAVSGKGVPAGVYNVQRVDNSLERGQKAGISSRNLPTKLLC